MGKRPSIDEQLDELAELDRQCDRAMLISALRSFLSRAPGIVVAKAAHIARSHSLPELAPEMQSAFERFMIDGAKTDKGCLAKVAIIEALKEFACQDSGLFRRGIRHIQMEPVWGRLQDMAGPLREACAYGLVKTNDRETHFELARLLLDSEPGPRIAAARALSALSTVETELILRMKVMAGDSRSDVLGECFTSLLEVNAQRSLPFVAEFLDSDDAAIVEEAALALGESHEEEAFEFLKGAYEGAFLPSRKEVLILPMALVRSEPSFHFVLNLVKEGHESTALPAVKALKIYANDPQRMKEIARIVDGRKDASLSRAYEEYAGPENQSSRTADYE